MFLPAESPYDLALGLAINKKAMLGLLPVSTTPPARIQGGLIDLVAQAVPCRRVPAPREGWK